MTASDQAWVVSQLDGGTLHVYPARDLREHDVDREDCWCEPKWDGRVLVHNSLDCRETFERGEKLKS